MKITLKGKPRSTNGLYKTMCRGNFPSRYLTNEGRALKEDYQWQAKKQMKGQKLLDGDLVVWIDTYHDTHRKNDWDNFHKLSMDSLTGIVYRDDSQIVRAVVNKRYDKSNPRIEISIGEQIIIDPDVLESLTGAIKY